MGVTNHLLTGMILQVPDSNPKPPISWNMCRVNKKILDFQGHVFFEFADGPGLLGGVTSPKTTRTKLVGGFNPAEKYELNWIISPNMEWT